MTYRGHVRNGQIRLDEPARLPEGAKVQVEVLDAQADAGPTASNGDLSAMLLRHAGKGCNLPADLASRHDHYAHGRAKP